MKVAAAESGALPAVALANAKGATRPADLAGGRADFAEWILQNAAAQFEIDSSRGFKSGDRSGFSAIPGQKNNAGLDGASTNDDDEGEPKNGESQALDRADSLRAGVGSHKAADGGSPIAMSAPPGGVIAGATTPATGPADACDNRGSELASTPMRAGRAAMESTAGQIAKHVRAGAVGVCPDLNAKHTTLRTGRQTQTCIGTSGASQDADKAEGAPSRVNPETDTIPSSPLPSPGVGGTNIPAARQTASQARPAAGVPGLLTAKLAPPGMQGGVESLRDCDTAATKDSADTTATPVAARVETAGSAIGDPAPSLPHVAGLHTSQSGTWISLVSSDAGNAAHIAAPDTAVQSSAVAMLSSPAAHAAGIANAVQTGMAPPHAAGMTAGAAFERMDSAAAPQVLESTPQRLAVGLRDSSLGWIEIRTHAAAGQVSAVLAAGSPEAQTTIGNHLPEAREYLAQQQIHLGRLSLEQFSPPSREGGGGRGGDSHERATDGRVPTVQHASPPGFAEAGEESLTYINVRV